MTFWAAMADSSLLRNLATLIPYDERCERGEWVRMMMIDIREVSEDDDDRY